MQTKCYSHNRTDYRLTTTTHQLHPAQRTFLPLHVHVHVPQHYCYLLRSGAAYRYITVTFTVRLPLPPSEWRGLPLHYRYITVTLPLHVPLHYRYLLRSGAAREDRVACRFFRHQNFRHSEIVRHQNLCYEIRKSGIRAELKRKSGINQKGRKHPNGKTFNLRKLVLGKGVLILSIILGRGSHL